MSSSILGEGTYGKVIPASTFLNPDLGKEVFVNNTGIKNDNVVKIFKRPFPKDERNYRKTITAYETVRDSLNANNGFRLNPYKNLKGKNIQATTKARLGITNNEKDIYAVRMPNLGHSIWDVVNDDGIKDIIRTISFPMILRQIVKVLQQLHGLEDAGYIHGDIRETNIMIHPITGTITIIDFDLLQTSSDFKKNIWWARNYNTPPEWIANGLGGSMDLTRAVNTRLQDDVTIYADLIGLYKFIGTTKFGINNPSLDAAGLEKGYQQVDKDTVPLEQYHTQTFTYFSWIKGEYKKMAYWRRNVLSAIKANYAYELGEEEEITLGERRIDGYDVFGFGNIILTFFYIVYSPRPYDNIIPDKYPIEDIKDDLISHGITKSGVEYTDSQLTAVAIAITAVSTLLHGLVELTLENRKSFGLSTLTEANVILTTLESAFEVESTSGGTRRHSNQKRRVSYGRRRTIKKHK
jgi:serine/threonine protein kinase